MLPINGLPRYLTNKLPSQINENSNKSKFIFDFKYWIFFNIKDWRIDKSSLFPIRNIKVKITLIHIICI